jgi:multiple sugar transport system substrate-binding protein
MKRQGLPWFGAAVVCAALAVAAPSRAADMVFSAGALGPIEEAQKMRNVILKDFPGKVEFLPDAPPALLTRLQAEFQGGEHISSLIGANHGDLAVLAPSGALVPLDDLAAELQSRGFAPAVLAMGKLGTEHQMYIPWMQATYFMVANKKALPYLPAGADLNALTFAQLTQWGEAVQKATGKRMVGFPAGPTGLMHRFFEGFLLPSYTGGVVTTFRSPEAEQAWTEFAALWKTVNPNSTNINFMQEALLNGDVWIGFDHVARLLGALTKQPDDFVAFPAPIGPKGRGWMPVVVGLSIAKGAPDAAEARALIGYLTKPETQLVTAREVGFFPVVAATLPPDLSPGLKMAVAAIERTGQSKESVAAMLPVGLGTKGGEFDKIFLDTFQRIVLRGEAPRAVLDRQGAALGRIMQEANAPCWAPDPPSAGACQVK